MSQLFIKGTIIELEDQIGYNYQKANIGDLKASKSDFTSAFKIPRTAQVKLLFDGLGIPGDMSEFPYATERCTCMEDYVPLYEGILVVLNTDKLYYHASVISGTIDFFKLLENKSFSDIDISEIIHAKTIANVADRLDKDDLPYTYMVGDWASDNYFQNGLNIDAMPVAVKNKYLLDQIFKFAQMTYSLPASVNLDGSYLTFPYPPYIEVSGETVSISATAEKTLQVVQLDNGDELNNQRNEYAFWTATTATPDFTFSGFDLICNITGQYDINFLQCIVEARPFEQDYYESVRCVLFRNTVRVDEFDTDTNQSYDGTPTYRTTMPLNAGDRLQIQFHKRYPESIGFSNITFQYIDLQISTVGLSPDGIQEVFGFGLSDYIKEIMWRYALIPVAREGGIDFIPMSVLTDNSTFVDWSDKYIERTNEMYDIGYYQNNLLTHEHVSENVTSYNRNIQSNNRSLGISDEIVESKIFAPPIKIYNMFTDLSPQSPPVPTQDFRTYDVVINDDGSVAVQTSARNYFVELSSIVGNRQIRLISPTQAGDLVLQRNEVNVAKYEAGFNQNEYWDFLSLLIDNTRSHMITLHLKETDVYNLDQTKPYFFRQESAFYILNNLTYKFGEPSKAEFIKINYNG